MKLTVRSPESPEQLLFRYFGEAHSDLDPEGFALGTMVANYLTLSIVVRLNPLSRQLNAAELR